MTDAAPAQRLYERAGWRRVGEASVLIPDEAALDVFVYLAPEPDVSGR